MHVGGVLVKLGHKVPRCGQGLARVQVQDHCAAVSPGRKAHTHADDAFVERASHGCSGVPATTAASNLQQE